VVAENRSRTKEEPGGRISDHSHIQPLEGSQDNERGKKGTSSSEKSTFFVEKKKRAEYFTSRGNLKPSKKRGGFAGGGRDLLSVMRRYGTLLEG